MSKKKLKNVYLEETMSFESTLRSHASRKLFTFIWSLDRMDVTTASILSSVRSLVSMLRDKERERERERESVCEREKENKIRKKNKN